MEPHILPFAQPDQRGGEHAVHGHGVTGAAADGEMGVGDLEVDVLARQSGQGWRETGGTRPGPGRYKPCDTEPGQADSSGSQERAAFRSEEHTSELQSLMRTSYDVFCLQQKTTTPLS